MKNWTYHPNIPAVIDPSQRDAQQGRSTLHHPMRIAQGEATEEIHYLITESEEADVITAEIITPRVGAASGVEPSVVVSQKIIVPQLMEEAKAALEIKLEQADTADAEVSNHLCHTQGPVIKINLLFNIYFFCAVVTTVADEDPHVFFFFFIIELLCVCLEKNSVFYL